MKTTLSLIPIDRDGTPCGYSGPHPEVLGPVLPATADLYQSAGFQDPWICYLALENDTPVGTCGFKAPPNHGRVEIAYFTFPDHEGRGLGTAMAKELLEIAEQQRSSVVLTAQTLPDRNASHRILEKLGFQHTDTLEHPEDGTIWEWRLEPKASR